MAKIGFVLINRSTLQNMTQLDKEQHFHPFATNVSIVMFEEINWEIWCNMNFSSYPMDKQVRNASSAQNKSKVKRKLNYELVYMVLIRVGIFSDLLAKYLRIRNQLCAAAKDNIKNYG